MSLRGAPLHILSTGIRSLAWVAVSGVFMHGCNPATTGPEVSIDGVRETALPPPILDVPASDDHFQTAVFAGGCFWSVELVFEHVEGVLSVVSGYTGGTEETARYDLVAIQATTDHAEVVRVTFDPRVVSYGQLLRVFFSVAHDPTQVDQQIPDYGREYRSYIFYMNETQRQVAEAYIDQIDVSGELDKPIATRLDPLSAFYMAEEEHQDFAGKNTRHSYILTFSFPKVAKLASLLPNLFRPIQGG